MKKRYVAATVVIFIFFLLLTAWLFWPVPDATQNDLAGVTIAAGQEKAAQQYALGLLYERAGDWDAAQKQYAEAAFSAQHEIQQAAAAGLSRVLTAKGNWRLAWQAQWQATIVWFSQLFFLTVAVAIVLSLTWLWRSARQPRPGYLVQSVQDFTKDGLGNGLHHLLFLQLQTAQRTQAAAADTLKAQALAAGLFPNLTPWQEMPATLSSALSALEKVNVAGVNVSLRPFAQTFYTLWRQQEYTITAQLHQRSGRLTLHVEIRHNPDGRVIAHWEIEGGGQKSAAEQREAIVTEWAYRLMALQGGGAAPSWRALAAYVNGLSRWQRYREDGRYQPDLLQNALEQMQDAQSADPFFMPAQFTLGTLYNALGKYEQAEMTFRNLLAANGQDDLILRYNLGVSIYHQVEKGIWARRKAAEQFRFIQKSLEAASLRSVSETTLLALTYAGLGMVAALEVSRRIKQADWQIDPEMKRLTAVSVYTDHSRKLATEIRDTQAQAIVLATADHSDGFARLQAKQTEEARSFLQQAIQRRPDYPVPYVNMAETYAAGSDDAITWLKRALDMQPGFAFGWFLLGQAYDRKSFEDPTWQKAAHEAFSRAVGIADAQERLGTMAFKSGDYQQAMTHYHTAIRLNSQKEHIWRSMAWRTLEAIEKGWIPPSDANLRDALRWADRAVELTSDTDKEWRGHDLRGWALRLLERPQDAIAALDRSIALQPQAQNLYHRAQVYAQLGNTEAAKADIRQAKLYSEKGEKWQTAVETLRIQLDANKND